MNNALHNTTGAEISHNGYVLCRTCGMEAREISKETSREYAYCLKCRPVSRPTVKEEIMPSVPKPSQAKKVKSSASRARRSTPKETKPKERAGVPKAVANLPQKGKMGALLKELRQVGSVTQLELDDACSRHKLSKSAVKHAAYLAKHLKLLVA